MTELDALQSERLDEALDNERETGHDGTDDVVDEDVDSMMEHL